MPSKTKFPMLTDFAEWRSARRRLRQAEHEHNKHNPAHDELGGGYLRRGWYRLGAGYLDPGSASDQLQHAASARLRLRGHPRLRRHPRHEGAHGRGIGIIDARGANH